jgi:hypothetical protein
VHVWDWVPQLPHPWVLTVPGAHAPWPVQAPKLDHWQVEAQVRDWVPQFPHDWALVVPGAQTP